METELRGGAVQCPRSSSPQLHTCATTLTLNPPTDDVMTLVVHPTHSGEDSGPGPQVDDLPSVKPGKARWGP